MLITVLEILLDKKEKVTNISFIGIANTNFKGSLIGYSNISGRKSWDLLFINGIISYFKNKKKPKPFKLSLPEVTDESREKNIRLIKNTGTSLNSKQPAELIGDMEAIKKAIKNTAKDAKRT